MSDTSSHDAHFLQKLPQALNSGAYQIVFFSVREYGGDEAVSCFGRIECCCAVECTVQRVGLGMLYSAQLIANFRGRSWA